MKTSEQLKEEGKFVTAHYVEVLEGQIEELQSIVGSGRGGKTKLVTLQNVVHILKVQSYKELLLNEITNENKNTSKDFSKAFEANVKMWLWQHLSPYTNQYEVVAELEDRVKMLSSQQLHLAINNQVSVLKDTLEEMMTGFDSEADRMDFILDICNGYKKRIEKP